jgi:hypothetical protein
MAARALPVTAKPSHELRLGIAALDDLDHIAIAQRGAQGDMAAIDLGPHRLRAQIGVDGKGKVDRRGALGHLEQRALGGEREDAVLIDRHLGVFEQFLGIVAGIENLDQIAQPAHFAIGRPALLVGPVGGQTIFVAMMHLARLDLHFDAARVVVDQRGVQALVAVHLGRGDVVLEPARNHLPGLVSTPSAL